jgi:hypothetical protein
MKAAKQLSVGLCCLTVLDMKAAAFLYLGSVGPYAVVNSPVWLGLRRHTNEEEKMASSI